MPASSKWGSPGLDLHWYSLAEEMNAIFKKKFGSDYPVTTTELQGLVAKGVIADIDHARNFVIEKMGHNDFFKQYRFPGAAVHELEHRLAFQRKSTCDLPQPSPND